MAKNLPAGDAGSSAEGGCSPGEGNGNPLQGSCLGNHMDRGAWQVAVHRVTESRTRQITTTHLMRVTRFSLSLGLLTVCT